jgi:hypothetical protein
MPLLMTSRPRPAWTRLFAELTIIVVGVLIAMAVDNWNTARGERALEQHYLRGLAADLRGDSATFQRTFLPAVVQKDSALHEIAPIVRGTRVLKDTLGFLETVSLGGRLGTRTRLTLTRRTTFDELSMTGNLVLIRSTELRAKIVDHYFQMEIQSDRLVSRIADYPMYVHQYYPAELRGAKTEEDVRAFGLKRAVRGFSSERFQSLLNQEMNYAAFARPMLERAAEDVNTLLSLVDAELAASGEDGGS